MSDLKFKNRWYKFDRTIETQLSAEYVPDWDLFKAIRESVQNMVDERTLTGAEIHWTQDGEGSYFYDKGSGVDFEDILYLGVSGKRELPDVVGQHGEGEIVSFLVAARLGVTKTMCSKDWLCQGVIENIHGHEILVLKVYKTEKPRKGTCWHYSSGWGEFIQARDSFMQTKRGPKRHILRNEPGMLYTRGMKVGHLNYLSLGYNLSLTPGRDRAGFTWEQIKDEVRNILQSYATVEDIAVILKDAMYWGPLEMKISDLYIDPEITRKAAEKLSGKKVVWATQDQAAQTADAVESGKAKVINPYGGVPDWVQKGIPNVISAVTMQETVVTRDPPKTLRIAIQEFKDCLGMEHRNWFVQCAHSFEDKSVVGYVNGSMIVLSKAQVKDMSFEAFIGTLAHEIAHIETGAADCTRKHESAVRRILTSLVARMVQDDTREHLVESEKAFNSYTSS